MEQLPSRFFILGQAPSGRSQSTVGAASRGDFLRKQIAARRGSYIRVTIRNRAFSSLMASELGMLVILLKSTSVSP